MKIGRKWKPLGLPFGPIYDGELEEQDSFVKRLREAQTPMVGLQIEMKNGRRYVIGHMNTLAGICDDCRMFDEMDEVVRVRRLIPIGAL